jgi:hypothetical protein
MKRTPKSQDQIVLPDVEVKRPANDLPANIKKAVQEEIRKRLEAIDTDVFDHLDDHENIILFKSVRPKPPQGEL